MRVNGINYVPLSWFIKDGIGRDQPLQESCEPGVGCIERAELLKQFLSGQVARVAEHVSLDSIAQTICGFTQPAERVIVQHPQPPQEGHEPVEIVHQGGKIQVSGDLAPGPLGHLKASLSPEDILDRVAGGGIGKCLHKYLLCHDRQVSVWQRGETLTHTLALRPLAGRFRQAKTYARITELLVRVTREHWYDDASHQLT